jgi:uncharacterized protein YggT (Ycf19 family)
MIAVLLDTVLVFMLLRSLLPLFGVSEESRFFAFLFTATEPFVIPVRFILYKLNLFQNSFIDMSFTFSFLLISMISAMLPII